jgi:chromosome segregation ATPase
MKSQDSGITLPPIRSTIFDNDRDNPFKVPPDEEILNVREMKTKAKEEKLIQKDQPIWEKGLKFNRAGALRKIEEIDSENSLQDEKITVAEAAHAALVTDRVRTRENIQKTIEKKREMFLLQMMIDIKKEEIKKLEQSALHRESGLKKSEDMLMEDMNSFNDYWDECKHQSHEAMRQAKKLNKDKTELTIVINSLNEEIQQLNTQISKHKESLEECKKYKEFLDKLVPHENDGSKFSDSEQLMEIFHGLVEQNLLLIQNIQELEQNLEQSKHDLEKHEKVTDDRLMVLTSEKQRLDKMIEEKRRRNDQLEGRLNKNFDNAKSGQPILEKLEETVKDVLGFNSDAGNQGCFALLGQLEHDLDSYLSIFSEIEEKDPNYMKNIVVQLEKERRDQGRNKATEKELRKDSEKNKKFTDRTNNPKTRKIGRVPIPKSKLPEKKVKKIVVETPQEELDRIEFLENED